MQRMNPDRVGDERTLLPQFLDSQRALIVRKSSGLNVEEVRTVRSPSAISVGGMLKHLTLVEDHWFDLTFSGNPERAPWASINWEADPDWEWRTGAEDPLEELLANYATSIDRSNAIVLAAADLEVVASKPDNDGRAISLRWILLHMLEETARHVGHLDLLRESIDGQVGD